jgi:alpha-mannosidase
LRRIDVSTELVNQEEFVRYRALFPTTIRNGKAMHEIPFGAIERPERQEFPAQNWIDYSDGAHGLALLNEGMPGNNVTNGKLMLSLMRSAKLISYGFIGGYEPGVGSDSGLGIGKKYTLNYAIMPHTGDWRAALPWRAGLEFNNPLIALTAAVHTVDRVGDLPARWGLVEVPNEDVVVSALKPSKGEGPGGEIVLRVYEAAGQPSLGIHANWHATLGEVHEANLMEDSAARVASGRESFQFDLKPYEIKTFKVQLTQR